MKTILSVKGYKIPKKSVTDDHISLIKKDLVINPFAFNMMGNKEEDNSYNIYTESDKFYYVPRFWGIENFGPPKVNKIPEGLDIDVNFKGSMRPYQLEIVDLLNIYKNSKQIWEAFVELLSEKRTPILENGTLIQLKKESQPNKR